MSRLSQERIRDLVPVNVTEAMTDWRSQVVKLEAENAELKRQLQEAEVFLAAIHMTEIDDATQITDGFGNVYPKFCEGCGAPNEIVRPGDCRCSRRCYVTRGEKP